MSNRNPHHVSYGGGIPGAAEAERLQANAIIDAIDRLTAEIAATRRAMVPADQRQPCGAKTTEYHRMLNVSCDLDIGHDGNHRTRGLDNGGPYKECEWWRHLPNGDTACAAHTIADDGTPVVCCMAFNHPGTHMGPDPGRWSWCGDMKARW